MKEIRLTTNWSFLPLTCFINNKLTNIWLDYWRVIWKELRQTPNWHLTWLLKSNLWKKLTNQLTLDLLNEERPVFSPDESIVIDPKDLVNPKPLHWIQIDHRFRNWQQNPTNDPNFQFWVNNSWCLLWYKHLLKLNYDCFYKKLFWSSCYRENSFKLNR
jgi:hypothetical protein